MKKRFGVLDYTSRIHIKINTKEVYFFSNDIVFAKGVSNHMGSAITENESLTTMVIAEAKNLFDIL